MALRIIRKDGDQILRKKSRIVDEINNRIKALAEDMLETMYDANGVGLAGPQIGILKRIIVIDIGEGPITLINPEIIEEKGEELSEEGCLSVPGVSGEVNRPYWVKAKGLDINGKEIEVVGEGLLARAICHEIDHLNGVLFTDKVERYVDND